MASSHLCDFCGVSDICLVIQSATCITSLHLFIPKWALSNVLSSSLSFVFSFIWSHFSSCHLNDFHSPKQDTNLNVSVCCQLPSRVWWKFSPWLSIITWTYRSRQHPHPLPSALHNLPSSHGYHLQMLRLGALGPSCLPSVLYCSSLSLWSVLQAPADVSCVLLPPGIEPHFCCSCLTGQVLSVIALPSHCPPPKKNPTLCSKLSPAAWLQHH